MAFDRTGDIKKCAGCMRRIFPAGRNGVWGYPDKCPWCDANPIQLLDLGVVVASPTSGWSMKAAVKDNALTASDKAFLKDMCIEAW